MHATPVPRPFEGTGGKWLGTHSLHMCQVIPYFFCILLHTSKIVLPCVKNIHNWLLAFFTPIVHYIIIIVYGAID